MSEEEKLKERLEALQQGSSKSKRRRSMLAPAITGGLGVIAGGYLVFVATGFTPDQPLRRTTSAAEEYQLSNIGPQDFASLDTANDAVDLEIDTLIQLVAELRARVKSLTENPVTIIEQDQAALQALDALQIEMDNLRTASLERDADFKRLLLERQTLAAQVEQLELALTNVPLPNADTSGTEDLARQQAMQEQRLRDELARQASLEEAQRRTLADAQLAAQINSPMVALRNSGSSATTTDEARQRYAGDEAFVRAGASAVPVTHSSVFANPSHTIIQGTRIEAVLENAVSSDLPGNITAIVSYDVYSLDMRRVLIPRGSKLFGRYNSDIALGQKRLLVAWDRLITTDQQSIVLTAYGSDRLGQSGMTGRLNTHFAERFGSAALVSVVGLAPALLARSGSNDIAADALEQVGQDFSSAMGEVMAHYLQMKPTITLDQGSVVTVIVNGDLELF